MERSAAVSRDRAAPVDMVVRRASCPSSTGEREPCGPDAMRRGASDGDRASPLHVGKPPAALVLPLASATTRTETIKDYMPLEERNAGSDLPLTARSTAVNTYTATYTATETVDGHTATFTYTATFTATATATVLTEAAPNRRRDLLDHLAVETVEHPAYQCGRGVRSSTGSARRSSCSSLESSGSSLDAGGSVGQLNSCSTAASDEGRAESRLRRKHYQHAGKHGSDLRLDHIIQVCSAVSTNCHLMPRTPKAPAHDEPGFGGEAALERTGAGEPEPPSRPRRKHYKGGAAGLGVADIVEACEGASANRALSPPNSPEGRNSPPTSARGARTRSFHTTLARGADAGQQQGVGAPASPGRRRGGARAVAEVGSAPEEAPCSEERVKKSAPNQCVPSVVLKIPWCQADHLQDTSDVEIISTNLEPSNSSLLGDQDLASARISLGSASSREGAAGGDRGGRRGPQRKHYQRHDAKVPDLKLGHIIQVCEDVSRDRNLSPRTPKSLCSPSACAGQPLH